MLVDALKSSRLLTMSRSEMSMFPCAGEACTIVLRGATQQILDEAERSLHDALCVLAQTVKETRTVYGGGQYGSGSPTSVCRGSRSRLCVCVSGCSEMLMAKVVTDLANRTPGKEAVAMESFAKALRMVRHVTSARIWLFREDQCKLKG